MVLFAEKSQYGTAAERSAAAALNNSAQQPIMKKRGYEQTNGIDGPAPKRPALGVIRQAGSVRQPTAHLVSLPLPTQAPHSGQTIQHPRVRIPVPNGCCILSHHAAVQEQSGQGLCVINPRDSTGRVPTHNGRCILALDNSVRAFQVKSAAPNTPRVHPNFSRPVSQHTPLCSCPRQQCRSISSLVSCTQCTRGLT